MIEQSPKNGTFFLEQGTNVIRATEKIDHHWSGIWTKFDQANQYPLRFIAALRDQHPRGRIQLPERLARAFVAHGVTRMLRSRLCSH
ncbi:hypothetical protein [Pigmentiphaga sp. CHJ604]|uniref:hypothetical protein n=1 Tax=Pigmentiphaga sp. CHJ604 TaxID=3081984 RepID=UPI0030D2C52D